MLIVAARVVIDAQPIQRLRDRVHVRFPVFGHVGRKAKKRFGGVGAGGDGFYEPSVVDGVAQGGGGDISGCVAGGCRRFEVQDDANVFGPFRLQRLHGRGVGQKNMVHGVGCCANVAQAGGVGSDEMRKPRDAPRFVDRGKHVDAVAKTVKDHFSVVGQPARHVSVRPAALNGKRRGHVPVIKCQAGCHAPRKNTIYQPVIEIETFGIHRALTFRQDAGP